MFIGFILHRNPTYLFMAGANMKYEQVKRAVEKGGSIRGAAKILKKPYTSVYIWLLQHGYEVVRQSTLRKRRTPARADHTPAKGEAGGSGGR